MLFAVKTVDPVLCKSTKKRIKLFFNSLTLFTVGLQGFEPWAR